MRWMRKQFRINTEGQATEIFETLKMHLSPVITPTHIVFAICSTETDRMHWACKMERAHDKDLEFVGQILHLAPKCPPTTKAD